MHIKIVKAGGHEYVRIVEAYRENGEVKQRVILNLGRKDQIAGNPSFARLAERLGELAGSTKKSQDLRDITEGVTRRYGFVPYRRIWQLFALDKLFEAKQKSSKLQINLNATCFLMVIQHLLSPRSKLSTYQKRDEYLGIPELDLHHLYRTLDVVAENKEAIEDFVFEKNRTLFSMNVDVVFYDVTTYYFESVKLMDLRSLALARITR